MIEYTPNAIHIPCDCKQCVKTEQILEHLKKLIEEFKRRKVSANVIYLLEEIIEGEKPQRITSTEEGRKFLGRETYGVLARCERFLLPF